MDTVLSVVVLLALFSAHHPGRSHAFNLMNLLCTNGSSYSLNSTYHSNVVAILGSLAADASNSTVGFATATAGAAPDKVWGLALCRGDVNGAACASCLALAPTVAFGDGCRGIRDVTVYYDRCLLTFSGEDFLSNPDDPTAPLQYGLNLDVNITGDPAGRFVELAADLVGALSLWAARNSTSRYAAGVATVASGQGFMTTDMDLVHDIYGMVQCTPDHAPDACLRCLGRLRDEMPAVFNGTTGAQFNLVWCNLRYEVFPFYDGSPVVKLVAPPPSTLAPAGASAGRNDANRTGNAATVVAVVLGVILAVAVLVSTLIIFLRRKAQGLLPDGRQIAVKRLDKASSQGLKQLKNELLLVAKLRHNNLAKLYGVCLKEQEKLLVYEYLPNRSLDTFLFGEPEKRLLLGWETRYRIIYGTARGLLYLHEDSQIKVVHRDLKANNILLDGDMNPKISDFGLARLFSDDKTTTVTSQVVGTLGYMAPEYAAMGHLSVKLDVYSFGVLVLEIVTGRRNTDACFESEVDDQGSCTLLSYVWDHWSKGTALETMDSSLGSQAPESEVLKCIHLGLLCVQENPADRPTTLDVLVMLHGQTSSFAAPSKPAFAFVTLSSAGEGINLSGGLPGLGDQGAAAGFSVNEMSVSEFQPR
nr:unnamed protein product [Digitaria exilis]